MALDLETLRKEMQAHLEKSGMPIFFGHHRMLDSLIQVSWDTEGHPDFREFIETAVNPGLSWWCLIRPLSSSTKLTRLWKNWKPPILRAKKSAISKRASSNCRPMKASLAPSQLSFALEGRLYLFELRTDWYDSMRDILNELEVATDPFSDEEEEEEGPIGGYFSNN